jgi:hypothetical protein
LEEVKKSVKAHQLAGHQTGQLQRLEIWLAMEFSIPTMKRTWHPHAACGPALLSR